MGQVALVGGSALELQEQQGGQADHRDASHRAQPPEGVVGRVGRCSGP